MNTRRKCSTLACNVLKKSKHVVKNTLIIPIYPHPNFVPLKKKSLIYPGIHKKMLPMLSHFLILLHTCFELILVLSISLLVLKLLKMLIVMIKICYTPFKIIGLKTSTILYFPKSLWSISFTLGSRTCTINVILKWKYHLQIISAVSEQMITNIIWIKQPSRTHFTFLGVDVPIFPSPLMEQISGSLNNGRGTSGSRNAGNNSEEQASNKYGCVRCGRSYQHQATLVRHQRYECGIQASYPCEYCNRKFKRRDVLKGHKEKCVNKVQAQAALASINPSAAAAVAAAAASGVGPAGTPPGVTGMSPAGTSTPTGAVSPPSMVDGNSSTGFHHTF